MHLVRTLVGVLFGIVSIGCTPAARPTPPVLSSAPPVLANPAQTAFTSFCVSWMEKLKTREKRNRAGVALKPNGSGVYGDYVGYSKRPSKCAIKPTGVDSNPYIGKLEYLEKTYRVQGASSRAAQKSSPEVMAEIEVLEIFRYDGSRWVH